MSPLRNKSERPGSAPEQQAGRWRTGLLACAVGALMLVPAALVLRSADAATPIIGGVVLAMWGIGGVAYGLSEILHLRE